MLKGLCREGCFLAVLWSWKLLASDKAEEFGQMYLLYHPAVEKPPAVAVVAAVASVAPLRETGCLCSVPAVV